MPPRSRRMDSHVDLFVSRMPAGLANSISSAAPGTSGETSSCAMSQVNVRWRRAVVVIGIHCDTPEPSGSARRPHSLRTDTAPYSGWHASCSVATAARRASASGEREEMATTTAVPIEDVTSNTSSPETSGRGRDGSSPIPTFAVVQGASSPAGRDRRGTGREERGASARAREGRGRHEGRMVDRVGKPRARAPMPRASRSRRSIATAAAPPTFSVVVRRLPSRRWPRFSAGGRGQARAGGGRVSTRSRHAPIASSFRCSARPRSPLPRQRRVARRDV